jgi:hypothetical protein
VHSGIDPPGETTLDPWLDDPFPDYDTEPDVASSGPTFVTLRQWKRTLSASDSGATPRRAKAISYQYPFEGELFPLQEMDHENHHDFWLPIFFLLTWSYTFVGVAGAWQSVGNIRPVLAGSFHRYQHFTGCSPGFRPVLDLQH